MLRFFRCIICLRSFGVFCLFCLLRVGPTGLLHPNDLNSLSSAMDPGEHDQGTSSQDALDGLDGYAASRRTYEDNFQANPFTPGLYTCILCGKCVSNRWHHISAHYPGTHRCTYCTAVYTRIDKLKTHLRHIHNVEIAKYSRNRVTKLAAASPGKAPYSSIFRRVTGGLGLCVICGKQVINFKNHYLSHFPERHTCPVCFTAFSRADNMRLHIRKLHPEDALWAL
uniref:C2H2-type domain-containing protein n=1 Tax=Timema bartmani TaxID=61472 RepID=A0A7R9HYD8_9NEOP|nr:unnamed protein product [Timema bartmani]